MKDLPLSELQKKGYSLVKKYRKVWSWKKFKFIPKEIKPIQGEIIKVENSLGELKYGYKDFNTD